MKQFREETHRANKRMKPCSASLIDQENANEGRNRQLCYIHWIGKD